MASDKKIIDKLNDLRSAEQRMSLVYRRAAQMVTGPSREALVEELQGHADEETEHADGLMRQIVAMDGDIGEDVKQIPVWRTLDEILNGLLDLEEEGIRAYQDLRRMLPEDDPFRFYIESTLEQELEHKQDVKRWLRRDYAEKSMGDYGSPKPLNWREPVFAEPVRKSASWEERADVYQRFGSPPTRRGGFVGVPSGLAPALPAEMNPPLILTKAVRQPQDPTSSRAQFARKRDAHGRFVESQQAGVESTAAEDADERKREAKLRAAKQREQMRPDWKPAQAGQVAQRQAGKLGKAVPGAQTAITDNAIAGAAGNQPEAAPVAETPSGKLLYDDPFHPEHDSFTPEDHQYAMQYHQQMSDMANTSGDQERAVAEDQKAVAHQERMQNAQPPMDRAVQQLAGQQAPPQKPMPGQPGITKALNYQYQPDNLNEFLTPKDQGKPSFGGPNEGPAPGMVHTQTGNPIGPQTEPGAPLPQDMGPPMDPMMQQPAMNPMAPSPMMQQPMVDPMAPQIPPMMPAPPIMPAQMPPPMDPMMQQPPMDPMMQQPGAELPTDPQQSFEETMSPDEFTTQSPSPVPSETDMAQAPAGADQMESGGPPEAPAPPTPPETPADTAPFGGNDVEQRADEEGKPQFGKEDDKGEDKEEKKPPFMKSLIAWRQRNA